LNWWVHSWLNHVPDKYADLINSGKISYDEFLEITTPYQDRLTKKAIMRNRQGRNKGLDLIG